MKNKKDKTEEKIDNIKVTINIVQSEKIKKRLENKKLDYRGPKDFVEKAIEKELIVSSFKSNLNDTGQTYYDMLLMEYMRKAYERALDYDGGYFKNNESQRLKEITRREKEKEKD